MQDKVEMNPLEIVQGQLPEIVNLDSKSETDSNAIKNVSKMTKEVKNVINNRASSSLMLETGKIFNFTNFFSVFHFHEKMFTINFTILYFNFTKKMLTIYFTIFF